MSAGALDEPAPQGGTKCSISTDEFISVCAEIEKEIHLTPPALINKLCKGEYLPFISSEAIFVEELLEMARKLGRMHLVTIVKGDP